MGPYVLEKWLRAAGGILRTDLDIQHCNRLESCLAKSYKRRCTVYYVVVFENDVFEY